MRRIYSIFAALAVLTLFAAGCAKQKITSVNEDSKRYLEAWISLNHPNAQEAGYGIYIIPEGEVAGKGKEITDSTYLIVNYTSRDLEGNIIETNSIELSKQLGIYDRTTFYGPKVWEYIEGGMYKGLRQAIEGMREGGSRRVIIPSWLLTYSEYKNADKYFNTASSESHKIYDIYVKETTKDILEWQMDSLYKYSNKYLGGIDTLSTGFFYKQLKAPVDTTSFPNDTVIYINYTGRLLDGTVFDTTIKDTAKVWGIYNSANEYKPIEIHWEDEASKLNFGTSDSTAEEPNMISGFQLTIWQMRAMEKGIGAFYSSHGYMRAGSGNSIPAYSPLVFEIELTEKPEDDK